MNFKFIGIYFCFSKNFRIRLFTRYCCIRQNKVIERIIEHYWYFLYQIKKLVTQARDTICIATNNYCQVLINFVNQNLAESSTSGVSVPCQEDVENIVVYQNVGVHGMISL